MDERIKALLTESAIETLERLSFIFAFTDDDCDSLHRDAVVAACVTFSGHFSGELVIKLSAGVLPELTANMLGLEGEKTGMEQQADALKETTNVICGNVLPAIAGENAVFDIDPPQIISENEAENRTQKQIPAAVANLILDDGRCDLFLFISGRMS